MSDNLGWMGKKASECDPVFSLIEMDEELSVANPVFRVIHTCHLCHSIPFSDGSCICDFEDEQAKGVEL